MPELPEVEVICERLRDGAKGVPRLVGRTLRAIEVLDKKVLVGGALAAAKRQLLENQVKAVRRRAKWILIDVDGGACIAVHLRMTGDLFLRQEDAPPRFERIAFDVGSRWWLSFTDPRRFGLVHVTDDPAPLLVDLGPEPLDDAFTLEVLRLALSGERAVKTALMDQSAIAGLGNIYSDESLFRAGLHPARRASSLDDKEVRRLHLAIGSTLRAAIEENRRELAWRYQNKKSESPFLVYERAGLPCRRCGTTLSSMTIAQRTSVFCPVCQPAAATLRGAKKPRGRLPRKTARRGLR